LIEVDQNEMITLANNSFVTLGYSLESWSRCESIEFTCFRESKQLIIDKNKLRIRVTDSYELLVKNKKGEQRHWLISGAQIMT
jgi:hypothetical protein